MGEEWPSVSVVMPVRNEAAHLEAAATAALGQDYPSPLELVLAIAPSTDETYSVARGLRQGDERVLLVDNPSGGTAAGLNAAIQASSGDVVVRVDGHAELSDGYIRRAVETLRTTGADNVGGIQRARGRTATQSAIAAAMTSRFGVGDARFHYGGEPGPVDTVYLGVFRRAALDRVGGFDETLVRNQDYELNWRLRDSGGLVWFDPELQVTYRPRASLRALARQYFEYGQWKRVVITRNPGSARWRHFVAPLAVMVNAAGLAVGATRWRPALAAPLVYLASTIAAALHSDVPWAVRVRLPAVFAVMHHAWGVGFILGTPDPERDGLRTGRLGRRR